MRHAFTFELAMSIVVLLLSACAIANAGRKLSPQDQKDSGIPACIAVAGSVSLVLQVPASTSSLANIINAASVEAAGSNAVDDIVGVLSRPQSGALLVTGEDEDLSAATLRAALKKLAPNPARSKTSVCFFGDAKYAEGFKAAAEKAGISVFTVQER